MNDIIITDEYLDDLRQQFKRWADFLNTAIGVFSFSLALACLGTKSPVFNAWLSLLVVTLMRYKGSHIFPAEIVRLRKAAKTDTKAKVALDGLSSEFMSIRTIITDTPVFLIGALLLMLIAASPFLNLSFLQTYIGT